jgi:hypothetical protein
MMLPSAFLSVACLVGLMGLVGLVGLSSNVWIFNLDPD